jgi:peptide chain release factor 2
MLMRMYIRWAEQHNYPVRGVRHLLRRRGRHQGRTFAVHAPFAYGRLSVEQGPHRLVRISPFDNQGRRQTSFAEVEVLPVTETTDHIDISESDVR